jgi:hypothetical protein
VEFLIVLAVLVVVVLIVTGPLRREYNSRARVAGEDSGGVEAVELAEASQLAELEAAREAKYREIRDAELDHRTGKLSDADFEAVDRVLRAEAVEILHRLDRIRGPDAPPVEDGAHSSVEDGAQSSVEDGAQSSVEDGGHASAQDGEKPPAP